MVRDAFIANCLRGPRMEEGSNLIPLTQETSPSRILVVRNKGRTPSADRAYAYYSRTTHQFGKVLRG